MLKLAADEDFNNRIVRGLLRRAPDIDIKRVQDAGLLAADDSSVLEWAAVEGRVLLTHDVTNDEETRVRSNLSRPSDAGCV
jgi:predicted nuclease of predicted toxin-antitoxin system